MSRSPKPKKKKVQERYFAITSELNDPHFTLYTEQAVGEMMEEDDMDKIPLTEFVIERPVVVHYERKLTIK